MKGVVLLFNHSSGKSKKKPSTSLSSSSPEEAESAFDSREMKYWCLVQSEWTNNNDDDETDTHHTKNADGSTTTSTNMTMKQRVVEFHHAFRRAMLKAGAKRTIHPVTNAEDDYDDDFDYGNFNPMLMLHDTNKSRIVETQRKLDPHGIFSANRLEFPLTARKLRDKESYRKLQGTEARFPGTGTHPSSKSEAVSATHRL